MRTETEFKYIISEANTSPTPSIKKWKDGSIADYDTRTNTFLIKCFENNSITYIGAFSFCFPENPDTGQIYILEPYRRQKYGTRFIKEVFIPYMGHEWAFLNGTYDVSKHGGNGLDEFLTSLGFVTDRYCDYYWLEV